MEGNKTSLGQKQKHGAAKTDHTFPSPAAQLCR